MILHKVKKKLSFQNKPRYVFKKRNEVDFDIFNKYQAEVSVLRTLPLTDKHVDTPDVHFL